MGVTLKVSIVQEGLYAISVFHWNCKKNLRMTLRRDIKFAYFYKKMNGTGHAVSYLSIGTADGSLTPSQSVLWKTRF